MRVVRVDRIVIEAAETVPRARHARLSPTRPGEVLDGLLTLGGAPHGLRRPSGARRPPVAPI